MKRTNTCLSATFVLIILSISAHSTSAQNGFRDYHFNNYSPKLKSEELRAQGIVPGKNIIHDQFDSAVMGPASGEPDQPCTMGFNVYLPADYYADASKAKLYPVVYYLHGGRGTENSLVSEIANVHHAIERKLIPPMVYVMAQGGSGGWFYHDHCRSSPRVMMETCICKELISVVESRYRVRRDRGGRAIQGFSMGGFGALKYAMTYPNMFSSVVAFSPGLDGQGNGLSQAQIDAGITNHNLEISDLVKRNRKEMAAMGIFLTHGAKGKELISILKGTDALVAQLSELGIPFTFYELNIGHGQSPNWRLKGDEALQFIAAHFK